ncbi:MAG: nitrilase-related carbon-nitrogen hydrolase [Candidatus Heimdallarchaeaceae archaeon]
MKCGYLQFEPVFCEKEANIDKILSLIEEEKAFDLLVLPELANSGYVFANKKELGFVAEEIPEGYFVKKLEEIASEKNGFIVSGICEKRKEKFFNSSVLIGPDGYIGTYRKTHLFDREKLFFEPGKNEYSVYKIRDTIIGMLICFDWIFPEATRVLALQGMDILTHPANLVLPYSQTAMLTRSVENQIYTITANRIGTEVNDNIKLTFTGQSQITSPTMRVLAQASQDKEEINFKELNVKRARNKWLNERNHIFNDRRTELYKKLVE